MFPSIDAAFRSSKLGKLLLTVVYKLLVVLDRLWVKSSQQCLLAIVFMQRRLRAGGFVPLCLIAIKLALVCRCFQGVEISEVEA